MKRRKAKTRMDAADIRLELSRILTSYADLSASYPETMRRLMKLIRKTQHEQFVHGIITGKKSIPATPEAKTTPLHVCPFCGEGSHPN